LYECLRWLVTGFGSGCGCGFGSAGAEFSGEKLWKNKQNQETGRDGSQ